jgi:copper transport protein
VTPTRGVAVAIAIAFVLLRGGIAHGHAGLRFSSPLDGATVGDSPTEIQLAFVEAPEPALSTIRVVDTNGEAFQSGRPEAIAGDPLSLRVPIRQLARGIYVVHWRVVSAIDGHVSAGLFVFGVQMDPAAARSSIAQIDEAPVVMSEVLGRALLLIGIVITVGCAGASLGGFSVGAELVPAIAGWGIAAAGLLLFGSAQLTAADVSAAGFAATAVGRATLWRALALVVAGSGLAMVRAARPGGHARTRQAGMAVTFLAGLLVIALHSEAGHAAAGRWAVAPTVVVHAIHFTAVAIWIGGLVALLWGLTGGPSEIQAQRIRRFSLVAAISLVVVILTGLARTAQELSGVRDLVATDYGRTVLMKIVLLAAVAGCGAINRWNSVPIAGTTVAPLRRIGGIEVLLAMLTLGAAGYLGAMRPPAGAASSAGIEASGSDFATTIRARLTAVSDLPGPNRFSVALADYDSGAMISADRVTLGFAPLDDPWGESTTLALAADGAGGFSGAGSNVSFSGRWRVNVLIQKDATAVTVPIEIATRDLPQFVSITRPPSEPPSYAVDINRMATIAVTVDPERPGPSMLRITCVDLIAEILPIDHINVTAGTAADVRQLPVERQDRNKFVAPIDLRRGINRITVIARSSRGQRLRAYLDIDVP